MKRLPPRSSLFPYTTLFRSNEIRVSKSIAPAPAPTAYAVGYFLSPLRGFYSARRSAGLIRRWPSHTATTSRSEEHTSELQSLAYLVCRLLLEKKNAITRPCC